MITGRHRGGAGSVGFIASKDQGLLVCLAPTAGRDGQAVGNDRVGSGFSRDEAPAIE